MRSPLKAALRSQGALLLLLVVTWLLPGRGDAFSPCGGDGQRACCLGERVPSCDSGLVELSGCSGDCQCGDFLGIPIYSSGRCVRITPCGGPGQRACCLGERSGPSCDAGSVEVPGCSGNCLCSGGLASSSGHCEPVAPCGGEGQRACCALERIPSCDAGMVEAPGCSGNCLCAAGGSSLGHCERVTPCGGAGQRACCLGERVPSCDGGMAEVAGCSGDCRCAGGGSSLGTCRPVTPCGGEGQRACCFLERLPSCDPGLFEMPFCSGDCLCRVGGNASGTCARPTPCGGKGQRACCVIERSTPCDPGLTEIPGCSGDCFCKGSGEQSSGTCTVMESIPEPDTAWTPAAPLCAMRGYADLHVHLFAHMAHGGAVLAGKPYDPDGGINSALRQDHGTDEDLIDNLGRPPFTPSCPPHLPYCGRVTWHGNHLLTEDSTGDGTRDGAGSNLGVPAFNGWPKWTSTTHQQAYYKWVERAYRGGLRLMVMLAVTNEALCRTSMFLRGTDCLNSMPSIDAQLAEAWQFQAFIDAQSGGPGQGWFLIAQTPAQARAAMRAGKMAVVLGIEVDNLFGCKQNGPCTSETVRTALQRYRDMGVRHVFPIHNFDNAFGATATWHDDIAVGNALSERDWWYPEDCRGSGYGFWLNSARHNFLVFIGGAFRGLTFPTPPSYPNGNDTPLASCNSRGLNQLGRDLLTAMMDMKMIIDIDHMSSYSLSEALTMAQARHYPLAASHVQFFDRHRQQLEAGSNAGRHERMRTLQQLQGLRGAGGMIAAMLKDDLQDTAHKGKRGTLSYAPSGVSDDCRHSTRSWAQSYRYALDVMGGPVALGSDFNGVAGHVGPRFGSEACGGDGLERSAQARSGTRLAYPFTLPGFGTFGRQVTGQKTFDFNVDGLAHIGLLPDMIADLYRIGMAAQDVEPIFRSAEAYIEMWERALGADGGATRTRCQPQSVVADASCRAGASVADPSLLEDTSVTLAQSPASPYGLGTRDVTLTVTPKDGCGPAFSCTAPVTVVDQTPPQLSCPAPQVVECAGAATPVTFPAATGSDNCGAVTVQGCAPASGSDFPRGGTAVTCAARDGSGNNGQCSFAVEVRDTTPPSITCPAPVVAECTGGGMATVDPAEASAADVCGGVTVTPQPARGFPLGTTPLTYVASDEAGLVSSCASSVQVVDTTPPSITCPAPAIAECTGAHSGFFAPGAAMAADACAGVTVSAPPARLYPLGPSLLTYEARDGVGLTAGCTSTVTVVDTLRPAIASVSASPAQLWPADKKMRPVSVSVAATDVCDPTAPVCRIVSIGSDQPVGGGPHSPDWQITGPLSAELRAERTGGRDRTYTLEVECQDQAGNAARAATTVVVGN